LACLSVRFLLALGVLARWYLALDIVNNGLPFLAAAGIALLALAFAARCRNLITASAAFLAVTFAVLISGLSGAASQAPDDAERFVRVTTFNLWGRNDRHLNKVAEFLAKTKADAVVLEEVRGHHADFIESLAGQHPYRVGDNGLVILSKHPIVADGRVDRADEPFWMSLIIRWVRLGVNGKIVELAGVHLARPFYPELQQADIEAVTAFVQSRTGPLIVAGDFNAAPWTVKLKTFTKETGLGRFNSYYPTWPMRWQSTPLLPIVPIDNVFASSHFAKIGTTVGPRLGSDHRPVIADIALIE
jgi:endonuclease/exonuclease/phosphatase (EEP) superfamily protein YafD